MRKKHAVILMISVLALITLASCSTGSNSSSTQKVRIIGTAKAVNTQTRAIDDKFIIDSVNKVIVDGNNITDQLKPSDPNNVKDGMSNVEFQADVEVFTKTSFEAEAKPGFIFDEWEVLELKGTSRKDKYLLDRIEDWLEYNDLEHSERLDNIPAEYITYLVAEYDRGFYVTLDDKASAGDGSKGNPFSVEEMTNAINSIGKTSELTLVISGKNSTELDKLIKSLESFTSIYEIKLKADGAELLSIPSGKEIMLSGFIFNELTINNIHSEYEFKNCTFGTLVIENANEIELKGGTVSNLSVINADEVKIENMEIDKLDLSRMTAGEVEIEKSSWKVYNPPSNNNVEVEIER